MTFLLMGVIVDRFYSRQGVARPWILFSAPLLAVSFVLLFVFPEGNKELMVLWKFISYNLFYSVAYTAYNTCHTLLVPLSTRNQEQRSRLSVLTNTQGMMSGMLVAVMFPTIVIPAIGVKLKLEFSDAFSRVTSPCPAIVSTSFLYCHGVLNGKQSIPS